MLLSFRLEHRLRPHAGLSTWHEGSDLNVHSAQKALCRNPPGEYTPARSHQQDWGRLPRRQCWKRSIAPGTANVALFHGNFIGEIGNTRYFPARRQLK